MTKSAMEKSSTILRRAFSFGLLLALLIAMQGCALTPNASDRMGQFQNNVAHGKQKLSQFFHAKFGETAGVDPRARDIERRLGKR